MAATNRNLEERTRSKKFRLDLLHRLNTFTLTIPPLRERPEDILELTGICLKRCNKQYRRRTHIGHQGYAALKGHTFPGNVRELINTIKQAVVMCDRRFLDNYIVQSLGPAAGPAGPSRPETKPSGLREKLLAVEYDMLSQAAVRCATTREAADFLGISQPTVVRKFKKHGIAMGQV